MKKEANYINIYSNIYLEEIKRLFLKPKYKLVRKLKYADSDDYVFWDFRLESLIPDYNGLVPKEHYIQVVKEKLNDLLSVEIGKNSFEVAIFLKDIKKLEEFKEIFASYYDSVVTYRLLNMDQEIIF